MELKTSWDLSLILKTDGNEEIKKLREKVKKESYKFINKWKDRTDYLEKPEVLKKALDEYNNWSTEWSTNSTELYYFGLQSALDQNNPKIKANINLAQEFGLKIINDIQFFELRIAKIDIKIQSKFLKFTDLKNYRHFLEKLFTASKYLLSEPEEKILNLKSAPAHSNWVHMNEGFLSKGERKVFTGKKEEVKNFSDILSLTESPNKKVRGSAAAGFNDILEKNIDVAENEINSILLNKKINDDLRRYDRPDKERHLADDIDSEVADVLVKTVTANFDIAKRYYKLKAELMKLPYIKYFERNVEYGNLDQKYSFEKGAGLINKVFAGLDTEFSHIFESFISEGRVDVYPKNGKRGGAFCSYDLITHPVYVLLNWADKLNDVRTLAHEMGHGINDELIKKNQNAINYGTPTSTAEVASTFMEDFVIQELLHEADEETRLALMVSKLNQDISSIFRQIAFYNFETDLHTAFRSKGYLSKDEIGGMFRKHMESYMGKSESEGSENWWSYISHFRSFFYVYSYASGLLISKSLQASVKKDPKFIIRVKEFLSAGESDSPKNIFANLGIDITDDKFWEKGIKEVEGLLKETEELAKKLGKM